MAEKNEDGKLVRDAGGLPILPGDVLKLFHFIGARNKRHYMYKQAMGYEAHKSGTIYLKVSHLTRLNDEPWEIGKNFFWEVADGRARNGWEVIQSAECDHERRVRMTGATDA